MRHTITGGAADLGESLPRLTGDLTGVVWGEMRGPLLDSSISCICPDGGTMRAFPSPGLEAKGSNWMP